MRRFYYKGLGPKLQPMRGFVLASSAMRAQERLSAQGIVVQQLRMQPRWRQKCSALGSRVVFILRPVSSRSITEFSHLMAALLRTGATVDAALEMVRVLMPKRMQRVLLGVRERVAAGIDIAPAFAPYSYAFPRLFNAALQSAETDLPAHELFNNLPKTSGRYRLAKRLFYNKLPVIFLIVLSMIIGVSYVNASTMRLIKFWVNVLGQRLLDSVYHLMVFTEYINHWGVLTGASVVGLYVLCKLLLLQPKLRYGVDFVLLYLPLLGPLQKIRDQSLLFDQMYLQLKQGALLHTALERSSHFISNQVYRRQVDHMVKRLRAGESLNSAMHGVRLLQGFCARVLNIASRSQDTLQMVQRVQLYLGERFDLRMRVISALISSLLYLTFIGVAAFFAYGIIMVQVGYITFLISPQ